MRKKLSLLPLVLIFIFLALSTSTANADKFTNASLRLDNQSAGASVAATVCAQPSSAAIATENKVIVTFPGEFTVSTNPSNWTTGTANLPQGSTAWPGISANATAVSNKSVTLSSSDLTNDVLYCFNLTSVSSNTGSAVAEETGTIVTKNSLDSTIDSTVYATSVLANNQIAVTATISPQISDLPISVTADTPGSNFPQDTALDYTVTYGTHTAGTINLTIQAEWSQGTVEPSVVPSVDILDYVVTSATNAYNSTAPVIDTINRTITWNITGLPGGTNNQTVTFKLKTNSNYTGSGIVNFDILARAISGSTVTPDEKVSQTYLYQAPLAPTPSPNSGSTGNTTATAIPAPATAQTPILNRLAFTNITIVSLSQSAAQIAISTNNEALLTLKYGNSPNSLTDTIKTLKKTKDNLIKLDNLEPGTNYYFRVTAAGAGADATTENITSDIFTFKTAVISPIPSVNTSTVIATSKDNLLINPLGPMESNLRSNIIAIPTSSVFSIQFSLDKPISLKTIQALVRNKNVLGFNNVEKAEAATSYVNLVEIQPGVYAGKLDSPKPGQYEIYVRLIDFNGNILEQKIADLLVTQRFKVLEKGTNNPIENVRVLLYIYNQTTKLYSVISSQVLPINNPTFTDPDGSLNLVLPYGIYKADISAIGYNPQSVRFEISPYTGGYPTVYLTNQGFNIFNTISYYSEITSDTITASQTYIRDHADSSRLFDIVTTGALFIFVLITLIAFSAKTHVSLLYIPYFLLYKLRILIKKEDPLLIVGKVEDELTHLPVSKATVYLENPQTGHIEVTLKTNKLGEFYYEDRRDKKYKISVVKNGFITPASVLHQNKGKQEPIVLNLRKSQEEEYGLLDILIVYLEDILGMFLEFLIVLGFIFEFYFIATFGFLRIAPFILISSFTFVLLLVYVYKPRIMK